MEKLSISEIDCSGEFDPDFHEALMQDDKSGKKAGMIVNVIAKGYTFKGKVIRHAKVSVAK